MQRSKEDIISQLHRALLHQTKVAEFWREQAMMLLERDVDMAVYGASYRGMVEVRDLGNGDED